MLGRNRILIVIAGIVLTVVGMELWLRAVASEVERPSPRALATFATETPDPGMS